MLEIMKTQLKEYIDRLDRLDEQFLRQILTIVKKTFRIEIIKPGRQQYLPGLFLLIIL